MALLMLDTVAPGLRVEQIVVRDGIVPAPACDQSIARGGVMKPDQFCAWEHVDRKSQTRKTDSGCLRLTLASGGLHLDAGSDESIQCNAVGASHESTSSAMPSSKTFVLGHGH